MNADSTSCQLNIMPHSASFARPDQRILLILAVFTAIRLAAAAGTGLVFDEAYYRLWGLFPGWAYFDHAPMVAWWVALGHLIAGDSALGTRLLGPLSAGLGSLLLWRTGFLLYGRPTADRSVLIFNAMLLPSVGSIVMTPDVPNVFFWGMTLWALAELRASQRGEWWLVIGLFIGLDLLSKYSGVFLGLGTLVWLVVDRDQRHWFKNVMPYGGAVIALALFSPVIIWNTTHDFVSFAKQLSRTQGEGFDPQYLFEMIGAQWMLMTPLIGGIALFAFARELRSLLPSRANATTLIIATSLPFAAYLLIHGLHDRVNANWPAPLAPAFAILAAVFLQTTHLKILKTTALPVGYALLALVFIEVIHPFLPLQPDRNPAMLTRGWSEMGLELEKIAHDKDMAWVATSTYEHTGAVSNALRNRMDVVQINERLRYGFMPAPNPSLTSKPALYINWSNDAEAALKILSPCIGEAEKIGTIARKHNDVIIETFALYRLTNVKIGPALYDRKADPSKCN